MFARSCPSCYEPLYPRPVFIIIILHCVPSLLSERIIQSECWAPECTYLYSFGNRLEHFYWNYLDIYFIWTMYFYPFWQCPQFSIIAIHTSFMKWLWSIFERNMIYVELCSKFPYFFFKKWSSESPNVCSLPNHYKTVLSYQEPIRCKLAIYLSQSEASIHSLLERLNIFTTTSQPASEEYDRTIRDRDNK